MRAPRVSVVLSRSPVAAVPLEPAELLLLVPGMPLAALVALSPSLLALAPSVPAARSPSLPVIAQLRRQALVVV